MTLIPSFFFDCVTAIGSRNEKGQDAFEATGFLYGRLAKAGETPEKSEYNVYLVTNRHVFEGHGQAILRFNPASGAPAKTYTLDLNTPTGTPLWSPHPIATVDVAAIPINIHLLKSEGIAVQFFAADRNVMMTAGAKSLGVGEGDGVFVLGFPLGEVGRERNYVIVRHGVVARIRDTLDGLADHFLIDATIFPGNSGGPVVTRPEAVSIAGTTPNLKASLLGIVSAYVPYQDVAVSLQTKRPRVMFEENTGLAVVVTADRIAETAEVAYNRQLAEDSAVRAP